MLDNVQVEIAKTSDVPGGFYDLRPQGVFKGLFESRLAGIYAHEINGLTLSHTGVVWGKPSDKAYGKGLDEKNVKKLELDHVSLNPSPNASPRTGK
jgi:hypothetical protein